MDRGKQYKTSTDAEEVKQLLKPLNPPTGLYEKTRSPKGCTGHGMHMCIPQIITCKMMSRCEMMCNSIKMPDPKQGFECSSDLLLFSGQEIHSWRCHFVLSRCYLKSTFLFFCFFYLSREVLFVLLAAFKIEFQKKRHLERVMVLSFPGFILAFVQTEQSS